MRKNIAVVQTILSWSISSRLRYLGKIIESKSFRVTGLILSVPKVINQLLRLCYILRHLLTAYQTLLLQWKPAHTKAIQQAAVRRSALLLCKTSRSQLHGTLPGYAWSRSLVFWLCCLQYFSFWLLSRFSRPPMVSQYRHGNLLRTFILQSSPVHEIWISHSNIFRQSADVVQLSRIEQWRLLPYRAR